MSTTEYLNNKVFEVIIDRFVKAEKNKAKYELILKDLQNTRKRKAKKQPIDDIIEKNTELLACANFELVEAKKNLATAFQTLSENIVRYAKFNLIDADDAIQEGVLICFDKINRFDPSKGKAFNYMTTCVLNHLRQLYRTSKNYNELKKKYHEFMQITIETKIVKSSKQAGYNSYNNNGRND